LKPRLERERERERKKERGFLLAVSLCLKLHLTLGSERVILGNTELLEIQFFYFWVWKFSTERVRYWNRSELLFCCLDWFGLVWVVVHCILDGLLHKRNRGKASAWPFVQQAIIIIIVVVVLFNGVGWRACDSRSWAIRACSSSVSEREKHGKCDSRKIQLHSFSVAAQNLWSPASAPTEAILRASFHAVPFSLPHIPFQATVRRVFGNLRKKVQD